MNATAWRMSILCERPGNQTAGFCLSAHRLAYITSRRMIKALLLVLEPVAAWERIVKAQRSFAFVLGVQLLPLLVLTSAAEGYGLAHWGKWRADVNRLKVFSVPEAIAFEVGQFILTLAVVFIGSHLIKSLGETFHGRHTLTQTFTTVTYSLSPLFLLRALDAFKWSNPWVLWGAGMLLSIAVLYHGLPRVMLPDPPHAFGLYLSSAIFLTIVTGLARFLTWWYLQGHFEKLETWVNGLAARLHF
jgi:hypothetical protein